MKSRKAPNMKSLFHSCPNLKSYYFLTFLIFSVQQALAFQELEADRLIFLDEKKIDSVELVLQAYDSLELVGKYKLGTKLLSSAYTTAYNKGNRDKAKKIGHKLIRHYTYLDIQFDKAAGVISKMYQICNQSNDSRCTALLFYRTANLKSAKHEYIEALKWYDKALKKQFDHGTDVDIWWTRMGIAQTCQFIGDSVMCRKTYHKMLKELPKENYNFHYMLTNNNLSIIYSNTDSIRFYANKVLEIKDDPSRERERQLAYVNLARSYSLDNQPLKTISIIENMIGINKIRNSAKDLLYSAVMGNMGYSYYQLGNYAKAEPYLKDALKGLSTTVSLEIALNSHQNLSACYEKMGEFQESLFHNKKAWDLHEQLDKQNTKKEVLRIEARKLFNQRQEEITKLERENAQIGQKMNFSRNFNYLLLAIVLIGVSITAYVFHRNKLKIALINEQLSINKIKALRAAMNPHFLFNSFSTLQNYILKEENLKANSYMTELSGLIRNVLSSTDSIFIDANKEIALLKSYIKLEQERYENKFRTDFKVDPEVEKKNPQIPSMMIQPSVENAINHGFSGTKKDYVLEIVLKMEKDKVVCVVKDNGVGRSGSVANKKNKGKEHHLSIATNNTKNRLDLLNKMEQQATSYQINDLFDENGVANGTEVIIDLPIVKDNKFN